jgi:4-carboxymuconolactone decarboxylase
VTGENSRVAPDLIRRHAPKLADLTDDVLFAHVWARPGLSPRERSLITPP